MHVLFSMKTNHRWKTFESQLFDCFILVTALVQFREKDWTPLHHGLQRNNI